MSIYFVRHGETPLNVARVLQPADTPLSERGQTQAQAVARRFTTQGLAAVLSSDLPRAAQTARLIGQACRVPVHTTPLLQERNFGNLRGRPYDELGWNPLVMAEAPTGGESMAAFFQRCAQAFAHVVAWHDRCGGPIAVVSHGLLIQALLRQHLHLSAEQTLPARLGNTSVTQCDAKPPHEVTVLDCTRHLTGPAHDDTHSLSGG